VKNPLRTISAFARVETKMARKKQQVASGFVLFDVIYEDGTQTSNRKVPAAELGGLDGDDPARAIIEMQDRKIGEMSGSSRGRIKTIVRSRKRVA
jgi:hypothetical protein